MNKIIITEVICMKNQTETNVNEKIGGGVKWYREKIVEMVESIDNLGTLQYLHRFLELFLEKWG